MGDWTWFKSELRDYFSTFEVKYDMGHRLRTLSHKEGHIHDYIGEFREIILQLPKMEDRLTLFHFMDGLTNWAKTEL